MFWKSDIAAKGRRYADTNEVERSNILAPGLPSGTRRTHLLPAFTPECFRGLALGSRIQLQQRNCSRFARDFSRRSTFQARKEPLSGLAARGRGLKHKSGAWVRRFCHVERQSPAAPYLYVKAGRHLLIFRC